MSVATGAGEAGTCRTCPNQIPACGTRYIFQPSRVLHTLENESFSTTHSAVGSMCSYRYQRVLRTLIDGVMGGVMGTLVGDGKAGGFRVGCCHDRGPDRCNWKFETARPNSSQFGPKRVSEFLRRFGHPAPRTGKSGPRRVEPFRQCRIRESGLLCFCFALAKIPRVFGLLGHLQLPFAMPADPPEPVVVKIVQLGHFLIISRRKGQT